jgi:hypothetical protein
MSEKQHRCRFQVSSATPPVVEIDGAAGSVYVRFKKTRVARTILSHCDHGVINLDVTDQNEVVGIEAVGFSELSIGTILAMAKVDAPKVDFSRLKMRWAGLPLPIPA